MALPPQGVPITAEGLEEVKRELDQLTNQRRPDIVAKIKAARELGDLSENFEYHSARNEHSFIEGRINELEAIIRNAQVIEPPSRPGEVGLLSTVTIEEEGRQDTYTIVGPAEADPGRGRISNQSGLGKALMGRHQGDRVDVSMPNGGTYQVTIVSVS